MLMLRASPPIRRSNDAAQRPGQFGQSRANGLETAGRARRIAHHAGCAESPIAAAALALAAVLVLVDAFLMNQGFISVVIGIGLVLIGLPRTFLPKSQPFAHSVCGTSACTLPLSSS